MATKVGKVVNGILAKIGLHIVKSDNITFLKYWSKQQYLEKSEFKYILSLKGVYDKISTVPGHIAELGVAYGRNAIIFSHLMSMTNENDIRKYYGFDTFDGFTSDTLDTNKHLSKDSWKGISVEKVKKRIESAVKTKNHQLIKGDILKTVPSFLDENPNIKIALLYIDCNAYEPAIRGMEFFKEFMSPGGIICIDEKKQGSETKAMIEFCEKNGFQFMKDKDPFSIPAYTVVNK